MSATASSPRLGLVDPTTTSSAVSKAFAKLPVINVFRAMANAESLYPAFIDFLSLLFQRSLDRGGQEAIFQRRPNMASKTKMIGSTESTQPEIVVEEREVLLRSPREEEIRNRAYEIYLQRGGQPGYELEDWLQAEREVTK